MIDVTTIMTMKFQIMKHRAIIPTIQMAMLLKVSRKYDIYMYHYIGEVGVVDWHLQFDDYIENRFFLGSLSRSITTTILNV